jgi:hypothetical protein
MLSTFYSALFTDKNKPCDIIQSFKRLNGWDYILFTNLDIVSDSWTIRKIELPDPNFIISAKMIKWLSHKYLSEYDIVYWMDAYCVFNNNKKELLEKALLKLEDANVPLFIKQHPSRDCIYDEADACLGFKKIDTDTYTNVMKFLNDHNVPRNYGLYETNSMLKINKNKMVIEIGKELIAILKKLTYRDQLILTYILFNHRIKKLETLDTELLTCDGKNAKHTYIKEDPRKIAICFFGLTRSLKMTLGSIKKYLLGPLIRSNIPYDIFLHTYKMKNLYSNPHAGEKDIILDANEYKLLEPTHHMVESKEAVSKKLALEKYRTHGNPWKNQQGQVSGDFTTLDNHILYLWSLKQLTKMWVEVDAKRQYSHIIYCRPDVLYQVPLDISWFSFTSKKICIPNFALCGNVTDRFALGRPEQMRLYGNRFDDALAYSKKHPLASEEYLIATMRKHKIKYEHVNFFFIRLRANGKKDAMDVSQTKTLTRKLRASKNKTRKIKIGLFK